MAYKIINIAGGVNVIKENEKVQCYLIEGNEFAMLLDSCAAGGEEFRTAVLSLTDKPIKLVLTHSDPDHTGGQEYFGTPMMHPAEFARYFSKGNAGKALEPLWEGQTIGLGGVELEVILLPGHTPGSIALLDRAHRRLFVGDTISDAQTFMFGDGRDLRAFIESLLKLETLANLFDTIHSDHGSPTLSLDWIMKTHAAAVKLLNGELAPKDPPLDFPCKLYSYEGVNFLF